MEKVLLRYSLFLVQYSAVLQASKQTNQLYSGHFIDGCADALRQAQDRLHQSLQFLQIPVLTRA